MNVELELIRDAVRLYTKIDPKTPTRKREVVFARALFAEMACRYTDDSLSSIGEFLNFSKQSRHTNIIHYRSQDWFIYDSHYPHRNDRQALIIHLGYLMRNR